MPARHDHWIGGKAEPPAGGAYLPAIDPTTRRAGDEVAAGTAADVDRAVAAASEAQPAWARSSGAERSEALHRVAAAVEGAADELMEAERACTGKLPGQLRLEVDMSASYLRYYAGVLRAVGGRTIDQEDGHHTYTRLEPYGVVAAITPWNLPLNQACRAVAPALAAGNAVVAKPSELTSTSTLLLARLATEAGLPDGLLNVVTGTGPDAGTPLAAHPAVLRVAFTGSVATGRHLAAVAAGKLVPLTLELGGKSPLVVFADAGDGPEAEGLYVQPSVYVDVPPDLALAREEVFGPVLVTMPCGGEEGAVATANDTDYGLVAAVWSGDVARGLPVAERIDAGQVAVNGGALSIETRFGGFKQSGYGREKGIEALHDYAQTKTISLALR
jgi:acyl-CoA reductase-like NAD-dependent aldehyde dehydrogenase